MLKRTLHRGNVEKYSDIDRTSVYREFSLRDTCSAIQYVSFSLPSKVSIAMHRIRSDITSKEVVVGVPDRRLLRFSLHHANRIAHRINPSIFQRRNLPSRVTAPGFLVCLPCFKLEIKQNCRRYFKEHPFGLGSCLFVLRDLRLPHPINCLGLYRGGEVRHESWMTPVEMQMQFHSLIGVVMATKT